MLKKLAITLIAVVFVGCYNLDNVGGKSSGGSIREIEIAGSQQTGGTTTPILQMLKQLKLNHNRKKKLYLQILLMKMLTTI